MGVVARLLVPVYYWKESVFVYGHCIDNTVHLTETRLSGLVDSYIKWKHQAFDQPCLIYIRDNVAYICLFDGTTIEAVPNCLPSAVDLHLNVHLFLYIRRYDARDYAISFGNYCVCFFCHCFCYVYIS